MSDHVHINSNIFQILVQIGIDLSDITESRFVNLQKIFIHGRYLDQSLITPDQSKWAAIKMKYNIALLRLEEPFTPFLNDSHYYLINTLCLPRFFDTWEGNDISDNETAYAFGYGFKGRMRPTLKLQMAPFRLSNKVADCDVQMFCASSSGQGREPAMCWVRLLHWNTITNLMLNLRAIPVHFSFSTQMRLNPGQY